MIAVAVGFDRHEPKEPQMPYAIVDLFAEVGIAGTDKVIAVGTETQVKEWVDPTGMIVWVAEEDGTIGYESDIARFELVQLCINTTFRVDDSYVIRARTNEV